MDATLRVVTKLPADELWRADGFVTRQRGSALSVEQTADLLRRGEVHFAVASVGEPLRWTAPSECFSFWRREVQSHLAAPGGSILLAAFPDDYCYSASQWSGAELPIVLLETYH